MLVKTIKIILTVAILFVMFIAQIAKQHGDSLGFPVIAVGGALIFIIWSIGKSKDK